ncbi:MAG: hypothetical protein AAGC67_18255 [Myxococcota bacterium]
MFRSTHTTSRTLRAMMLGGALASLALAGSANAGDAPEAPGDEVAAPANAPTVFATIDGAALDALAALRSDRNPATRGRFRVGRILAVPGGYVWEAAQAARPGPRPVVRLSSGPDHVATYLSRDAQPSSSRATLRRQQQRVERALVDTRDAQHRPLFVLTAENRVLAYRGESKPESVPAFAARER